MTGTVYRLVVTETFENGSTETISFRPVNTPSACKGLFTSHCTTIEYRNGPYYNYNKDTGKVTEVTAEIQAASWVKTEDLRTRTFD